MVDFAYVCTKARLLEELGQTQFGDRVVLAELQFENEHGEEFSPVPRAVVVFGQDGADVERYPENILSETHSSEEWERWEQLCAGSPGYDVYNPEELAKMLGA